MDAEKVLNIAFKTMIGAGIAMVGLNVYAQLRFAKFSRETTIRFNEMQEESERLTKETFQHANRVFKAADAQASNYQDIIDGKTPFIL